MSDEEVEEEIAQEVMEGEEDPSVPPDLLELHLELEEAEVSSADFKEAFGDTEAST